MTGAVIVFLMVVLMVGYFVFNDRHQRSVVSGGCFTIAILAWLLAVGALVMAGFGK